MPDVRGQPARGIGSTKKVVKRKLGRTRSGIAHGLRRNVAFGSSYHGPSDVAHAGLPAAGSPSGPGYISQEAADGADRGPSGGRIYPPGHPLASLVNNTGSFRVEKSSGNKGATSGATKVTEDGKASQRRDGAGADDTSNSSSGAEVRPSKRTYRRGHGVAAARRATHWGASGAFPHFSVSPGETSYVVDGNGSQSKGDDMRVGSAAGAPRPPSRAPRPPSHGSARGSTPGRPGRRIFHASSRAELNDVLEEAKKGGGAAGSGDRALGDGPEPEKEREPSGTGSGAGSEAGYSSEKEKEHEAKAIQSDALVTIPISLLGKLASKATQAKKKRRESQDGSRLKTPKERSRDEWRKKLASRDKPRRGSVALGAGIAAAAEAAEEAHGLAGSPGNGSPSAADVKTPLNTVAGDGKGGFFGGSSTAGKGGPGAIKRSKSGDNTGATNPDAVAEFRKKIGGGMSIAGLAGGITMLRRRARRRIERRKRRHSIASDVQADALVRIPSAALGAIARMQDKAKRRKSKIEQEAAAKKKAAAGAAVADHTASSSDEEGGPHASGKGRRNRRGSRPLNETERRAKELSDKAAAGAAPALPTDAAAVPTGRDALQSRGGKRGLAEDVVEDPSAAVKKAAEDEAKHLEMLRRKQGETALFRVAMSRKPFAGIADHTVDKHYRRRSMLDASLSSAVDEDAAATTAAAGRPKKAAKPRALPGMARIGVLERANSIGHLQPGRGVAIGITKEQLLGQAGPASGAGASSSSSKAPRDSTIAAEKLAAARLEASTGNTQHTGLGQATLRRTYTWSESAPTGGNKRKKSKWG